ECGKCEKFQQAALHGMHDHCTHEHKIARNMRSEQAKKRDKAKSINIAADKGQHGDHLVRAAAEYHPSLPLQLIRAHDSCRSSSAAPVPAYRIPDEYDGW